MGMWSTWLSSILTPTKPSTIAKTPAEVLEALQAAGEREVERPQAEDGAHVGGEGDEGVAGDGEHGRHRVDGEDEVGGLDGHEGDDQRGEQPSPGLPHREGVALVVDVDGKQAAGDADHRVPLRVDLHAVRADQPVGGEDEQGAEQVDDPLEAIEDRCTPTRMKVPRSTMAPKIPQNSTLRW